MEAKELRTLGVDELKARCKQWSEELFRARFKAGTAEAKDTSVFKKLRKDIARAQTVLTEKLKGGEAAAKPVATKSEVEAPADKPATKKATVKKTSAKKSKE